MLPNFIIIGAMKGGTTSLYHYLSSHPDLIGANGKETDFFLDRHFDRGMEWYERQFQGSGRYAFEASPNYSKRHLFPRVAERMHETLPDAKLIYVLRDPVQRAWSHYLHKCRSGKESRTFGEAIRKRKSNYVLTSRYHYQLKPFLKHYDPRRILLITSEDLESQTHETMNEISRFLDFSPDYKPRLLEKHFHTTQQTRTRYMDAGDRELLVSRLSRDVSALRQWSGKTFACWSL